MILESFGQETVPWKSVASSFKTELGKRLPASVQFHEAGLEAPRGNEPEAEQAFANYLRIVYARNPPDLVVPVGGVAAHFWWRVRQDLFPSSAVVIGGIEARVLRTLPLGSNDTAVAVRFDDRLDIILDVLPATTNIAVVLGHSKFERFWMKEIENASLHLSNRAQVVSFETMPFAELCRRAAALPPRSAVFFGAYLMDPEGVPQEQRVVLEQFSAAASVPVFGAFEEQLGTGILGGRLFSGRAIGRETAAVAARVLRGERAGSLPPRILDAAQPVFDSRELPRWGLSERELPTGSAVLFRHTSAWDRYRGYVLGALGIMLLQAITIAALLIQRTRRRRAEASLDESRQFIELATAADGLGLWVGTPGSGDVWVNSRLRATFEFPSEKKIRWNDLLDRVHPDDRERAQSGLARAARDGGSFEFEGRLRLPIGGERWIRAQGMASHGARTRPIRTQGVVFDITDRHQADLEVQRHRNELLHVGRVHVVGQLSCALAHELNQPLGAILSNADAAELLFEKENGRPAMGQIREILSDIRKDNQRASDVIRRMRALLRRHEMEMIPIRADQLVAECIALTRSDAIERKVALASEATPGMATVRGDRVHLEQVLLNLLINAMDAMRDCPEERRRLRVRAEPGADDTVMFSVSDSGHGIAADQLERIFESFHTTKENGLGIGLSISRTIVEAHHGRLWAENDPGGGAVFRFTLPVFRDEAHLGDSRRDVSSQP